MFRRDSTAAGDDERYTVIGLWGSGNVVTGRSGDVLSGYSMWDGHALFGPERPGELEKFPALVATMDVAEFVDRYAGLGEGLCELWGGEEVLGEGCRSACAELALACPSVVGRECAEACADQPRQVVECIARAPRCDYVSACNLRR